MTIIGIPNRILWRKPLSAVHSEVIDASTKLVRKLTLFDLLAINFGGAIGTGLFAFVGLIASQYAGPSGCISWLIAGLGCSFSGLSYAEVRSMKIHARARVCVGLVTWRKEYRGLFLKNNIVPLLCGVDVVLCCERYCGGCIALPDSSVFLLNYYFPQNSCSFISSRNDILSPMPNPMYTYIGAHNNTLALTVK